MSEHEQHKFVVIHFDLRIAGFSDRVGLYIRLAAAMEGFFQEVVDEYQRDGVGEEAKKEYENTSRVTFLHSNTPERIWSRSWKTLSRALRVERVKRLACLEILPS